MSKAEHDLVRQEVKAPLNLGWAVRRMRESRKMPQEELARRAGVTQPYISQLESGYTNRFNEKLLAGLAAALEVELWELIALASGVLVKRLERLTQEEVTLLDVYRALNPGQREALLRVGMTMQPPPAARGRRSRSRSD